MPQEKPKKNKVRSSKPLDTSPKPLTRVDRVVGAAKRLAKPQVAFYGKWAKEVKRSVKPQVAFYGKWAKEVGNKAKAVHKKVKAGRKKR